MLDWVALQFLYMHCGPVETHMARKVGARKWPQKGLFEIRPGALEGNKNPLVTDKILLKIQIPQHQIR